MSKFIVTWHISPEPLSYIPAVWFLFSNRLREVNSAAATTVQRPISKQSSRGGEQRPVSKQSSRGGGDNSNSADSAGEKKHKHKRKKSKKATEEEESDQEIEPESPPPPKPGKSCLRPS